MLMCKYLVLQSHHPQLHEAELRWMSYVQHTSQPTSEQPGLLLLLSSKHQPHSREEKWGSRQACWWVWYCESNPVTQSLPCLCNGDTTHRPRQLDTSGWWRSVPSLPLLQGDLSGGAAASVGSRCAGVSWSARAGWGSAWPWWSSCRGHSGNSSFHPQPRSRDAEGAVKKKAERCEFPLSSPVSLGYLTVNC